MRRNLIFLAMLLLLQYAYSQLPKQIWTEDFDGTLPPAGWTVSSSSLSGAWEPNTIYYYQLNSSLTTPQSYRGKVPTNPGDSLTLTTPVYDCTDYGYVYLRFNHICKVSPNDNVRIEYSINMGGGVMGAWKVLPWQDYLGEANDYSRNGFSAASYPQWKENDSTVFPLQSWWKEELFDLSNVVGQNQIQFRFVIKRGTATGTQLSYGWLLDNFRLEASGYLISPPVVEFMGSYPKDTVYSTGPYEINVKVKAVGNIPIEQPYLKYTVTEPDKQTVTDSILLTHVQGDSLWKTTIGQYTAGTEIQYSITGKDLNGNDKTIRCGYVIKYSCGGGARVTQYLYTGREEAIMLSSGKYEIEVWGADGESAHNYSGGKGGYSKGIYTVTSAVTVYLSVGGKGQLSPSGNFGGGGWNGGGAGYGTNMTGAGGGGATHLSLTNGFLTDMYVRNNTLIVAGGGGGAGYNGYGGNGGGTIGGNGNTGIGGAPGGLIGAGANTIVTTGTCGGGGGGWFGGQLGVPGNTGGSGGGSGYIGGLTNGVTVQMSQTGFIANPITDGNGFARITALSIGDCLSYSAGTYSIDVSDTVATSPTKQVPITVTIRNAGIVELDSLVVSYSVNGSAPVSKNLYFNPALLWDFIHRDTAGYYNPKVNGFDTVVVWVSLPNGQIDTITWDDTSAKHIYGRSDIVAEFVDMPADTVSHTGPHEVTARITSLSGAPINQMMLNVTYTYENISSSEVLSMTWDASSMLWKAIIPKKRFGTDVAYSISLTDIIGNNIQLSGSYFIKKICGNNGDCDTNSVALESINSSGNRYELAGSPVPVHISIRNTGVADLASCYINWSLNGTVHPETIVYRGKLPDDFTDTITIGFYIPVAGKQDTIAVWVSMPNSHVDPNTSDDMLRIFPLGCVTILTGTHKVGSGGTFANLNEAFNSIRSCGISGNTILQLKGVDTTNVNLSNISDYMQGYTLTITSYDNDPDSAVIYVRSGVGVILNNTKNIIFDGITINGRNSSAHVVNFTGLADNIVFNNCKILGSITATSSYYCFYKASNTGKLNNLRIKNCRIEGGYSGIYFNAASGDRTGITNVHIDSNTITQQYYYGIYTMYVYPASISYNTISPRSVSHGQNWSGMYINYADNMPEECHINGNRISSSNTGISSTIIGIDVRYSSGSVFVTNNEIYLKSAATYTRGIYIYYNYGTKFLHNTVLLTGTGGNTFYALSWYSEASTKYSGTVKNNMLIANREGTNVTAYAMHIDRNVAAYQTSYQVNYNNYFSTGTNLAYLGTAMADLRAWKSTMNLDIHSVNILPSFANVPVNLSLVHDMDLTCPLISPVTKDILDSSRYGTTTMGCYAVAPMNGNVMLEKITGLIDGSTTGQTENISVVIYNTGTTPVTHVNLGWSINGNTQGSINCTLTNPLQIDESAIIVVAPITYPAGNVDVKVWVNNLNNNTLPDEKRNDDTVSCLVKICQSAYSGLLTVGQGMMFPDILSAYNALALCGVSSDIIIELQPEIYIENIDLLNSSALFGNHKLTITSSTGNAEDVILRPSAGAGITLNNSNNLVIKGITVDVSTQTVPAIQFTGACTNVIIRDCRLLGNTTTSTNSTTNAPVSKVAGTGVVDNISFINNTLDGGYYGWYFYGGTGTGAGGYGTRVVFDSNTVSNWYTYGTYPYYVDFISYSYNLVLSRAAAANTYPYPFNARYVNGPVIGNRINVRSTAINSPSTFHTTYYNYYNASGPGLIANNEIITRTTGTYYGMYLAAGTVADIIHNSILVKGTGAGRGIYVIDSATTAITVKNNNIVMEGLSAHPVYLKATTYLSQYFFDCNNMYAPQYAGYAGGDRATIASWRSIVTSDKSSVKILPELIDSDSLKFVANDTLLCFSDNRVSTDITGERRPLMTTMGAYTQAASGQDLMLVEVIPQNAEAVNKQVVQVSAKIVNTGAVAITSATFGWSLNGQIQQTGVSWTANPAINAFEQRNVPIGTFTVTHTIDTYDVKVWIETINGQQDTVNWNDTISNTSAVRLVSLAEFVAPFIRDTIGSLSFDINVKIHDLTGALLNTPKMYIETIMDGYCHIHNYDTIDMRQEDDKWVAKIPKQYYGSKIIYQLHISDTVENKFVLMDSTYIKFDGSGEKYAIGNNLAILDLISPVNTPVNLCEGAYLPVQISLENLGENDYDFIKDNIAIGYEIIDSRKTIYKGNMTIDIGKLLSGESMNISLMSALPIFAGRYEIKAWLTSAVDEFMCDDTLSYTYISGKIGLPINEYFNSTDLPYEFISTPVIGTEKWEPYQPDASFVVQPNVGMGMLRYTGSMGTMAQLTTRQLDLDGTVNPKLEFWYYHDTAASALDDSYTDVNVVVDGNSITALSLLRKGNFHGWKPYVVNLSPYTGAQCVFIQFKSMDKFGAQSAQYIDRILITSEQDVEVSDIIITPSVTACSLTNKELKVVLSTTMNQSIDFSNYSSDLIVEITGRQSINYSLQGIAISGQESDTLLIATDVDFLTETTLVKAYLSVPIDANRHNDTAKAAIVINPQFAIEIEKLSSGNLARAGFENYQEISITNTGNMELSDIGLVLSVRSDDGAYTFNARDIFNQALQPNGTADFTFSQAYTIPWCENYTVKVHGYLMCDSMLFNKDFSVQENVDMVDLKLVSIEKPEDDGAIDVIGSSMEVEVNIQNLSPGKSYTSGEAKAGIMLTDTNGNPVASLPVEGLPTIGSAIMSNASITYTFDGKYMVPNLTEYYLVVYIDGTDQYNQNDTLKLRRTTNAVGTNDLSKVSFTMEQNIPNPAKGNMIINYSIPQDGEILFNVYSASGQLLYTKQENVSLGKHQIKLNLSDYASGVYFYTMEYNGQRISKRMSIAR